MGLDPGQNPTIPIKINSRGSEFQKVIGLQPQETEALKKELHSRLRNVVKSSHHQPVSLQLSQQPLISLLSSLYDRKDSEESDELGKDWNRKDIRPVAKWPKYSHG